MANAPRDLIKCKISNTPGTGSGFTLDSAVSNFLMPASTDDTLQFKLNITENGVGTEIRKGCTYTHSTPAFSRGTMVRSTGVADAALDFTSAAVVSVVPSAEDYLNADQAAAVVMTPLTVNARDGLGRVTSYTISSTTYLVTYNDYGVETISGGGLVRTVSYDADGFVTGVADA